MISRMMRGAAMRATPPSLRMSAGTRSSAITAQAPASSAIFACAAVVTSMITPPLSISARPTFTRHRLLFIRSILSPLSISGLRNSFAGCALRCAARAGACGLDFRRSVRGHAPATHLRALRISAVRWRTAPIPLDLTRFHKHIFIHGNELQIFYDQFSRSGANLAEAAHFGHGFIEQRGNDAAMNEAGPPQYSAPEPKPARMRCPASSCSNVSFIPRVFAPPQPKQGLSGLGLSSIGDDLDQSDSRQRFVARAALPLAQFDLQHSASVCMPRAMRFSSSPANPRPQRVRLRILIVKIPAGNKKDAALADVNQQFAGIQAAAAASPKMDIPPSGRDHVVSSGMCFSSAASSASRRPRIHSSSSSRDAAPDGRGARIPPAPPAKAGRYAGRSIASPHASARSRFPDRCTSRRADRETQSSRNCRCG